MTAPLRSIPRRLACALAALALAWSPGEAAHRPTAPPAARHGRGARARADSLRAADRFSHAAAAVEAERQRLHIPGLALAIVADDRVVLARGFGVRDLATRE